MGPVRGRGARSAARAFLRVCAPVASALLSFALADDSYFRAHEPIATGTGWVKIGAREVRLDQAWAWTPLTFADRAGLVRLLAGDADPAPITERMSTSLFRHRTYPLSAWSTDAKLSLTLVVSPDERGVSRGRLTVEGALKCRADVTGDGLGTGWWDGTCDGSRTPVRFAVRAWRTPEPFQLPPGPLKPLGSAQPDWTRTAAYCATRGAGPPPYCGPGALLRLSAGESGRQQSEPLWGAWVFAKTGGVLVFLPWADTEEIVLLPGLPSQGGPRRVDALAWTFRPDVVNGRATGPNGRAVELDFDGTVLRLYEGGKPRRRVVPDPLVATGIVAALQPR